MTYKKTKKTNKTKKTKKPKKPNKTKSIKSQRGGSGNVSANHLPSVKYSGILSKLGLDSIKTLFETTFDVRPLSRPGSSFTLNTNLKDTFLQDEKRNFLEWYKTINPKLKNISELTNPDGTEFKMPEFKILVANLAKDLVLMIETINFAKSNEVTNKRGNQRNISRAKMVKEANNSKTKVNDIKNSGNSINSEDIEFLEQLYKQRLSAIKKYNNQVGQTELSEDNKRKIIDLLERINDIISTGYIYKEVQDLYLEFLNLVSIEDCKTWEDEILKIYNETPYIVFPTHYTLDFKEVVNLCSVPILNFKFMNRRRLVHFDYRDPCNQIDHDILFHSSITHNYNMFSINKNELKFNKIDLQKYCIRINKILNQLKAYYNYNEGIIKDIKIEGSENDNLYDDLPPEIQKLCFGIILFYLFHEDSFKTDTVKNFRISGKIDKFTDIEEKDIGRDDDPNAPTVKYPILTQINWKSVYDAFKAKLIELGIV